MENSFKPKGVQGLKNYCAHCTQHIDNHIGPTKTCPSTKHTNSPLLDEFTALLHTEGGIDVSPTIAGGGITSNDVLVVVDMQYDFLPGGSFGVAEGNEAVDPILKLIKKALERGATVIATRDYHPINHCSFSAHGGPYPPHCVQGSRGSFFEEAIGKALFEGRKKFPDRVKVVFKGFHKDVDSYGAYTYNDAIATNRICRNNHCELNLWTGAFDLLCSNAENDINAPPDVTAVLERQKLADFCSPSVAGRRVFAVGLAFDYCVLDTVRTAAAVGMPCIVVKEATRAAHIPGFGKFGTGFLTNPAEMGKQLTEAGCVMTTLEAALQ